MNVRAGARRFLAQLQDRLLEPLGPADLAAPAVVFAPHPDDETLGCGGTIVRKRESGADVGIVFMTDGAQSHAHRMPAAELASLRADEAVTAAQSLGVPREQLTFFAYPDGRLGEHVPAATEKAVDLLRARCPRQIFVPYPRRDHPDHVATHRIVTAAIGQAGLPAVTVLEYPVWFWRHWPWVAIDGEDARDVLEASFDAAFGLRVCQELRACVDVRDALPAKRAALAAHATQVKRRHGDPRWPVLGDVSGGDFVACFFQDREIFRRISLKVGGTSTFSP